MQPSDQNLAVAGCLTALGTLVPVALFQSGLIRRLPDPPGAVFDSAAITSSKTAHPFGIPDSYLGVASYSITLGLLLSAKDNATARELLGAKLAIDVANAGFNSLRQLVQFGKICSWCTGTALATALMAYGARSVLASTLQSARQGM